MNIGHPKFYYGLFIVSKDYDRIRKNTSEDTGEKFEVIILWISTVLLAINFVINKIYQKTEGNSAGSILEFNMFLGLFTAGIFYFANGFHVEVTRISLFFSLLSAVLVTSYTVIGFQIMAREKVALYTVFLMAGGMVLPYLWGILVLDEAFSLFRSIGVLLVILAMIVINHDGKRNGRGTTLLGIAVFVINGFVSIISKEHQIHPQAVSAIDFVILSNMAKTVFSFCVYILFFLAEANKKEGLFRKTKLFIILSAIVNGLSYFGQLYSAETIAASVLYPVVTGGTVILTAVFGWIFFAEKITKRMVVGLGICLIGTCMFL